LNESLAINGSTRYTILVNINEGGAYDNVSNSVIIPVTGVYYLMLTVNALVASPTRHRVMLNANTTALEDNRPGSTVSYDGYDYGTTEKSTVLLLTTYDVLTCQFSEPFEPSMYYYVSYSGFLLYPK
jgi:hypothetical protein